MLQGVGHGPARQIAGDVLQREAMGQTERQDDGVIGGCRLQLEVERATEFLAQRQSQAAVDPRAERAMDDQLHAPRVIEEALQHQVLLTGHDAQRCPSDSQVSDDRGRGVGIDPGSVDQHLPRTVGVAVGQIAVDPQAHC